MQVARYSAQQELNGDFLLAQNDLNGQLYSAQQDINGQLSLGPTPISIVTSISFFDCSNYPQHTFSLTKMNDPETQGNGNNETSTAETHYNEQNPEDRRDVLRSMAIGLGLGGIPTPLKKHLIKEAHRRYDLLDLRNAHPRPLKPSKTMWSVDQITRWLEEYPLRGNSCIAFIQATLQTTMPAGNGNNMNALPLDTLEEGGEETVGVEVDDVDPAPAAGREAATRIQDDQPQQHNDDTLPDPVADSTTAPQPPQQATPAVKVGKLKSPPVPANKSNVPIEKLDRRVLMTRVLGLPGCCLEKGLLRH